MGAKYREGAHKTGNAFALKGIMRILKLGFGVYMIIRTDFFPAPFTWGGLVFTPRVLTADEMRDARTYISQWRELYWIGYLLVKAAHFMWVFLWTLDEKKAHRKDPFSLERQHVRWNTDKERETFGWRRFLF